MKHFLKDYALSLTLGFLWVSNWIAYGISLAYRPEGFEWQAFWEGTFENNASEFLQLLSFVTLTTWLIHKGSHESKDSTDRQEKKIDTIIEELRRRRVDGEPQELRQRQN